MKGTAAAAFLSVVLCALLAAPAFAEDADASSREDGGTVSGGAAVLVLPPPPSSEHGLCGGAYCETASPSGEGAAPNPATGERGRRGLLLLGGAALLLPGGLLPVLWRRGRADK